jgi:riboflavin synthase
MFTGIIEAVGQIARLEKKGQDALLTLGTGTLDLTDVKTGDSIAVNGVCLTAVRLSTKSFSADVSAESLALTTLGQLTVGDAVNLEKALTPQTRLGGHLVSGHVDGIGILKQKQAVARSIQLHIQAPAHLAKYIAKKGSICVDGISLTVNEINGAVFQLNIVPHTLAQTTLQNLKVGQRFNLEVDLLARYLERLLSKDAADAENKSQIDENFLAKHGFI